MAPRFSGFGFGSRGIFAFAFARAFGGAGATLRAIFISGVAAAFGGALAWDVDGVGME